MEVVWEIAALATLAGALVVAAVYVLLSYRLSPERKERMRRLALNQRGRLGDGMVIEVTDGAVYYNYSISGVSYTTSQDISQLSEYLPDRRELLIGPAWLKYSTQNPANSIVVCEQWSGLRRLPTKETVI